MNNIEECLNIIAKAQYGIDMRQAIHDGIKLCYDDAQIPDISPEALEEAVQKKIDSGELALMTIPDGSITKEKLDNELITSVTPEMYGAVGDGVTDDTTALQTMFDSIAENTIVNFQSKKYFFEKVYVRKNGIILNGNGVLYGILVIDANEILIDKCKFKKQIEFQYSRGSVVRNCIFGGEIGIYVPSEKTVSAPDESNDYNDPWFHSVARLIISNCTFEPGTSCLQIYYDESVSTGWMRANDWIFSGNVIRGVDNSEAIHDMYIQGIDGIRIEGNTFFTADIASHHQCPILEMGRCDWVQIINNNFFPATKEFIKLKNPTNLIIDSNHFAWQVYTDMEYNNHACILIEMEMTNQSLNINNNNASQITGNFIELKKNTEDAIYVYGNIIGNICFFNDRTGGVVSGNCYVAYADTVFDYIKCFSNIIIGNLSNEYYVEGYNIKTIGEGKNYELTSASTGDLTDVYCATYNGYCEMSFTFAPSSAIEAYTVVVKGMPAPRGRVYNLTVTDSAGNSFPAFIDSNGFKLRRTSGTHGIFVTAVYRV